MPAVYSLGVMLYQTLVGRFPYDVSGSVHSALGNILTSEPARPSSIRKDVDDELETIVLTCLRKQPDERYQSAGEVAQDIRNYLAGEPIRAKGESTFYLLRKQVRKHRVAVAVIAAFSALVAVSSVVGWTLYGRSERALAEAGRANYVNSIALASEAHKDSNIVRMEELLTTCPAEFRRWEWGYLDRLRDGAWRTFEGHGGEVISVAINTDGTRIVSGGADSTLKVWDAASSRCIATIVTDADIVRSVAFSPDGTRIASGDTVGVVQVWSMDGASLWRQKGHDGGVWTVVFSPDGNRLASGGEDNVIRIWSAQDGVLLGKWPGHDLGVTSLAFSSNGQLLASGSADSSVLVWDTTNGTVLVRFEKHTESVDAVSMAPDGRYVVSGDTGGSLFVWETGAGNKIHRLTGHAAAVTGVVSSADGEAWDVVQRRPGDGQGVAYDVALRKAEVAARILPNDARLLNTLGVAQYRVGAYKEAYASLSRARELRRDQNPHDAIFLAMTLFQLGREDEAKAELSSIRGLMKSEGYPLSDERNAFLDEAIELIEGTGVTD